MNDRVKNIILISSTVMFVACGPSDDERVESSCSQLAMIPADDDAQVLEIVNDTRDDLGLRDFIGSAQVARDAVNLGICPDLLQKGTFEFADIYEESLSNSSRSIKASKETLENINPLDS